MKGWEKKYWNDLPKEKQDQERRTFYIGLIILLGILVSISVYVIMNHS